MLKIGITGGIGSGKTTVCRIFSLLGIPVYYADIEAKKLMQADKKLVRQVKLLLGNDVYDSNQELRRQKISRIVFNDQEKLTRLNSMVHPAVKRDFMRWCQRQKKAAYVIKEAALMFESGSAEQLDKVIMVYAPLQLRIRRIMARDQAGKNEVIARSNQQIDEEKKIKLSDYVIYNDGKKLIIPQVLKLHKKILALK